jgi:hypothetical protein
MATTEHSVRETSRHDSQEQSLTVEEHRSAASTGHGEPASAPVNQRYKPEPVPKQPTPGVKVGMGAITDGPYSPPLDLDPRNIEAIEGFEEHKGYLATAQDAFSTAFEGLKKIAEGRTQAAKNPGWNDYQQLLQVGGFAEKVHLQICKAIDTATNTLQKGVQHIEKELKAPLEAGASSQLSKEIRDHVKGLPETKRGEFLAVAIRENDTTVINALLGFPHYLSGLNKSSHDHYTYMYRKAQKPELVGRQSAMEAAYNLINQRTANIHAQVEKAMRGNFATLKRVREASSAAEKALAFEQANNPLIQ